MPYLRTITKFLVFSDGGKPHPLLTVWAIESVA
jgi:hypothetical protein